MRFRFRVCIAVILFFVITARFSLCVRHRFVWIFCYVITLSIRAKVILFRVFVSFFLHLRTFSSMHLRKVVNSFTFFLFHSMPHYTAFILSQKFVKLP